MIKSHTFSSNIPGHKVLILGAVHGDEIAGTIAQQEIISEIKQNKLSLKSGEVTFIPTVNEAAQKADTRSLSPFLSPSLSFKS